MFAFVKQIFVSAMMIFGCNISSLSSLKYVSMSNRDCTIRPEIIDINSNEPTFYPYSIKVSLVAVVIILTTHIQTFAFLMLLKT